MKAQHTFITLDSRQLLLTGFGFDQPARECAVIVPPFAEEMNKSRRMMAQQGAALARAGHACCYIDLSGTGDSEGSFATARWEHWIAELRELLDFLQATYGFQSFDLIGIRLGFLLALETAAVTPLPVNQVVGWQPVANGATYAKQFLRLRAMAAIFDETAERTTAADLRRQLTEDGMLEVAGYPLHEALLAAIEAATLEDILSRTSQALAWFDVQTQAAAVLSPASQRSIASIPAQRLAAAEAVCGEPFWSTVEIGFAPALIEMTTARLTGS